MRARFVSILSLGCVFVVSPAIAQSSAAKEKYDLSYKFKPGQKLRWDVVHRATIKTTIQGTTQTAATKSESVKVWEIEEVNKQGEISLLHYVESVKMVNQLPNRAKVEYDSQRDATPPLGFETTAQAVGVPLTELKIDKKGKILNRVQRHIQPGGAAETPMAIPLPAEPVEIGHVWSEPHTVTVQLKDNQQQKIKTRRRFELKSVKGKIATISVDYQVLTPVQDPSIEAQLAQRLSSGELQFDMEAGCPIAEQLDVDKRVVGFSGAASTMHYLMSFTERLLGENEKVAKKPVKPAGPPLPSSSPR